MWNLVKVPGGTNESFAPPEDVVLGGTVLDGALMVLASDDTYYDTVAADGAAVSGVCVGGGTVGTTRGMIRIQPSQIWEVPYSGTPSAAAVGALAALLTPATAMQTVDMDDLGTASKNICFIHSYDTTAVTCRVSFITGAIAGIGAGV